MRFLSKQIEAQAKRLKQREQSLIKRENSCGIFQDYGSMSPTEYKNEDNE